MKQQNPYIFDAAGSLCGVTSHGPLGAFRASPAWWVVAPAIALACLLVISAASAASVPDGRAVRAPEITMRAGRCYAAYRGATRPEVTAQNWHQTCPAGNRILVDRRYGVGPTKSYYVDSIHGSDANRGSSASTAWRTLARLASVRLRPGARILLRRGSSWPEMLVVSASGSRKQWIVVDAYGTGPRPSIHGGSSCVILAGSFVTIRHLFVSDCSWAGVEISGSSNRVEKSLITRNAVGVDVSPGATRNVVLNNDIVDNDKMSVLTRSPTNDDAGAFGILLRGDWTEVARNRISGSDAFSYDYGRDGSAVEVFGGRHNDVRGNVALDNHDFTELGNSDSADNTFAYNLVRSSLANSAFLVTRGAASSLGPVLHTDVYNNTVYLTGSSSQGFICYAGCSPRVLSIRNNIIVAAWKVGYADAPFGGSNNLFSGGLLQFGKDSSSIVASPQFEDPSAGDFHLRAHSPAIDAGVPRGYTRDLVGEPVPRDGDGDGVARPDLGAIEYQPQRVRVKPCVSRPRTPRAAGGHRSTGASSRSAACPPLARAR